MPKNKDEINIDTDPKNESNAEDEVRFDNIDEEGKSVNSVKKIREKLRACEEEKKEFLDGWQRCKADAINTRKRDEELRLASIQTTKEDVLLSILPVLDSFEMAFSNKEALDSLDPNWVSGMQQVQNQLIGIFSENGIEQINPEGEKFNPSAHESVEIREVDDKKNDDKVIEVIQRGYIINAKVLRAAKVVVGAFKSN